jgi:hypothetical protein
MFELQRDVDPVMINQMNSPTEILTKGSEANLNYNARARRHAVRLSDEEKNMITRDLERILETFEQDEILQERLTEATFDDPILLLLAQHRSFRISRKEFFCPIQNCRPRKPITSLRRLATRMQTFHGAPKEEMIDIVRYLMTKL